MRESLFAASLRAFFLALFAVLGLGIALVPLSLIWSGVNTVSDLRSQTALTATAMPNAQGRVLTSTRDVPLILQIDLKGEIGNRGMSARDVENQLLASQEGALSAGRIKGLLLCINSPGGTAFDSDAIYRYLKEYKERFQIPIYAYVDGACASGAFYASCAADKIYASSASCIGSVGVIARIFNYSKLADTLGIEGSALFAGKGKDELDSWRPWTPGEGKNSRRMLQACYERFVDIVCTNRNIERDVLVDEMGAGFYPAKEALQKSFVDQIEESRCKALEDLARECKVDPKSCAVIQFQPKVWLKDFLSIRQALGPQRIVHEIRIPGLPEELLTRDPMGLYCLSSY